MTTFANANCRHHDVETFYPHETDRAGTKAARDICRGCPALDACLEFVMSVESRGKQRHGIYAGLSPRQRADLARARSRAAS